VLTLRAVTLALRVEFLLTIERLHLIGTRVQSMVRLLYAFIALQQQRREGKGSWMYIAPHYEKLASEALSHDHVDHTVFTLQLHHTCLYLVKHSPDGATTDSDNSYLIAVYYSFINPNRMKG